MIHELLISISDYTMAVNTIYHFHSECLYALKDIINNIVFLFHILNGMY